MKCRVVLWHQGRRLDEWGHLEWARYALIFEWLRSHHLVRARGAMLLMLSVVLTATMFAVSGFVVVIVIVSPHLKGARISD